MAFIGAFILGLLEGEPDIRGEAAQKSQTVDVAAPGAPPPALNIDALFGKLSLYFTPDKGGDL